MIDNQKIKMPYGIKKEVAKRCNATTVTVDMCFFYETRSVIGVGKEKRELILKTAVELAKEKRNELDSFIAAVETTNISAADAAVK